MSKGLVWIRKSKGSDDDVGLELQREKLPELAEQLVDDYDVLDLGVHTGFSLHSRAREDERIDSNPDVLAAVERLTNGDYDALIAWDDTRISRDEYFGEVQRACLLGDAEIHFFADVAEDGLTFDVKRAVEKRVKQDEIKKSKAALARRREQGYYEGKPRYGTQYDENKQYLVPNDDFDEVLTALSMRDEGASYRKILENTGISSTGTLRNLLDRREFYEELARAHGRSKSANFDAKEGGDESEIEVTGGGDDK